MTNKFLLLFFITLFSFSACQSVSSAEKEIREQAKQKLTSNTPAPDANTSNQKDNKRINKFNDNKVAVDQPTTTMNFKNKIFDYGTIKEGEKAKHSYVFTNTGTEPLIISNAKGSCGCTVPSYSTDPVLPGETGAIDVVFDSKGKPGTNSKTVTLTANTEPVKTELTIKGKVTPKPKK